MPISSGAAGVIGAGADILSSGINAIAQGTANRQERKWQEKMYGIQRADALADWNMQNAYNSPAEQMKRYKDAGLNPNLIYGNGSASSGTAGSVRSSSSGSYSPKAPQIDLGAAVANGLNLYFDTQLKQAQVENLHANNALIQSETARNSAMVPSIEAGTSLTKSRTSLADQQYGYHEQFNPISLEQAKENVRKTNIIATAALDANERAAAMQAPNLQKAFEAISNMRMQRIRMKMENEVDMNKVKMLQSQMDFLGTQQRYVSNNADLLQSELERRSKGGSWKDSGFFRALQDLLNDIPGAVKEPHDSFQKNFDNWKKSH